MSKWEKIEVSGWIPQGAILRIGGYLWKVMRRVERNKSKKIKILEWKLYIREYKPIEILKK